MSNPKLVPCKTCKNEISKSASKCPHCGEHDPADRKAKGCAVFIILAIFICVLAYCSANTTEDADKSNAENNGVNTLGATLADWKAATYEDRLAVALQFMQAAHPDAEEPIVLSAGLRLETCLSEVAEEPMAATQEVVEAAAICATLMKFGGDHSTTANEPPAQTSPEKPVSKPVNLTEGTLSDWRAASNHTRLVNSVALLVQANPSMESTLRSLDKATLKATVEAMGTPIKNCMDGLAETAPEDPVAKAAEHCVAKTNAQVKKILSNQ